MIIVVLLKWGFSKILVQIGSQTFYGMSYFRNILHFEDLQLYQ